MNDHHDAPKPREDQGLGPLIDRILAGAPSRRVLDLGCGSGRHARLLVRRGCEVVAIDASEAALERARGEDDSEGVEYLLGDMGAVEARVRGHFGAAICLGNTLPCLLSPESLSRMFIGLKRRLLPSAPFLFQVLNYDRLLANGERALPVRFTRVADEELVVVQLMEPREDGIVVHTTSRLRYRSTGKLKMEVVDTHAVQLRAWRRAEIEILLDVAGLLPQEVLGDLNGTPYDPHESLELVMVVS